MPYIRVIDLNTKDYTLTLDHVYDGRELDIVYAKQTLKYIQALWGRKVRLITKTKECKEFAINCNENGELTLTENSH